jgi:CRP-like cAMP-binding protein
MSDTKNILKDKANSYFDKGSYKKALEVFEEIYNLDPYNEKEMLLRVARCYELIKDNKNAILTYIKTAKEFAESGFFLKAIASLKNVLELEPKHIETQELIANLYAKNGKIYEKKVAVKPLIKDDSNFKPQNFLNVEKSIVFEKNIILGEDVIDDVIDDVIIDGEIISKEDEFSESEIFANEIEEPKPQLIDATSLIKPLPEIPLFSKLDKDAFIDLMNKIELKKYRKESLIIKEGDDADALYIILSGEVKIIKELEDESSIEIARLKDGAFFGEMALLGNAQRMASVEATTDLELFVISKTMLDNIINKYSSIRENLFQFYRNRLLYNIINFSPMFQNINKEKRLKLIKKFRSKRLFANQVIIEQNGVIPGLFLVLEGKVKVYRVLEDGSKQDIITVSRGAILGEMSLIKNSKPMASCLTEVKTWVLRLPPEDFDFLRKDYPEVIEYLNDLKVDREYELDLLGKLNIGIY